MAAVAREARRRLEELVLLRWVRLEREGGVDARSRHVAYVVAGRRPVRERGARARRPRAGRRRRGRERPSGGAQTRRSRGTIVPPRPLGVYCLLDEVPCARAQKTQIIRTPRSSCPRFPVEFASDRTIRTRNKISYRFNHWPIWIWVFFIAPGPLTFDLFAHGFDWRMASWLGAGAGGHWIGGSGRQTARRGTRAVHHPVHRGQAEPALPAHLLHVRVERGRDLRRAQYRRTRLGHCDRRMAAAPDLRDAYFPIAGTIWLLRVVGMLPRVKRSTKNEGHERRYFYGSVWAACVAQPVLWLLWNVLPRGRARTPSSCPCLSASWRRRKSGATRPAAPHAPDRARRAGGLGLGPFRLLTNYYKRALFSRLLYFPLRL